MNSHPHGEQLSAYLDGMLDVAQMRDTAAHLGACPSCRDAYQSLMQTKTLLGKIDRPDQPAPEFWTNAYRRMRLEDAAKRSPFPRLSWEGMRDALREPQRRWSAGLAAAALVAAVIVSPVVDHGLFPAPPTVAPVVAPAPDSVDVSSLVQAHTESAARQPLADADRQDMIAMDDSFTADDNGPEAANAPDAVNDAAP